MTDRIQNLRKTVNALNDAGVRKTLFYPMAYASLSTTRGESIETRRAKAEAYILEHAPLLVLPDELLVGSCSAYFPLAENVPTREEQLQKAHAVLDDYLRERETRNHAVTAAGIRTFEANFTTKKSRWALMSRVYHDASISYDALQKLIADMTEAYAVGSKNTKSGVSWSAPSRSITGARFARKSTRFPGSRPII